MAVSSRSLLVSLVVGVLGGCGAEPPKVTFIIEEGATKLEDLERLQLIVRECGQDTFAARADLIAQPAALEAAIPPGRNFYAWIQGWIKCIPPETGCIPEENAALGECACVEGGKNQILVSEACTPWIPAEQGRMVRLTLSAVPADPAQRLCPPRDLRDCDVLE